MTGLFWDLGETGGPAAQGRLMNDIAKDNLPRIDAEEILAGIREWVEIETPVA